MKRILRMGGRKFHTERDFNAERKSLAIEFEEMQLKHASRISQISQDTALSTEERKFELSYERAILIEEQSRYQDALREINESEAAQYEGAEPDTSQNFADEYSFFGTKLYDAEPASSNETDNGYDY